MKWLKITLFPLCVHIERVTEQKSRAESRLVAHANQPGSQKMALEDAGCGSEGRSLIISTLNIECLLLLLQNAGAGLPAAEEILKSNSAEWDRVAFWVSFWMTFFFLEIMHHCQSCAVGDCHKDGISRIPPWRRQGCINQGSKSQVARASPVVSRRCVGGLDWFAYLAASLFVWI